MTDHDSFASHAKLQALSPRRRQLWVVVYVEREATLATVERDVEASLEGGADAVVLEISKDPDPLALALAHIRTRHPQAKVGVNYLGGEGDPYGYITSFRLARELELPIVWTDFCGVDLVNELPEVSLHAIEAARVPGTFYCSGIHMKYGTLLDSTKTIERSALQAMGWVDGIVITGPRTGVATDPEQARRARAAIGSYPLGVASGVTAENFASVAPFVDYCLVNSSIADAAHRILAPKVTELRRVMGD